MWYLIYGTKYVWLVQVTTQVFRASGLQVGVANDIILLFGGQTCIST